jgi:hypothetical protein
MLMRLLAACSSASHVYREAGQEDFSRGMRVPLWRVLALPEAGRVHSEVSNNGAPIQSFCIAC